MLDILANDYPYSLCDIDLEHRTCHGYRLASRWLADTPLIPKSETTFAGPPVSKIKFFPGHKHKFLLTVPKGFSSALTIWDITRREKCSEWIPGVEEFTGVIINEDPESKASVAVSFYRQVPVAPLNFCLIYLGQRELCSCIWTTKGS